MRHLITLADLSSAEIKQIFSIAEDLKAKFAKGLREPLLPGRVLALLFEKPSLRTRVSFEAAIAHLGGSAIFLGEEAGFGKRESIADFGRTLGELVDAIVVRAKRHETVVELAQYTSCSVINGLTHYCHPCQAMADLFTIHEMVGRLEGHTITWVGDANNVARSLAVGCGRLGMKMIVAAPKKYQFDGKFLALLKRDAPTLDLSMTEDPVEAVRDAVVVYTDVWASMGQEAEREVRKRELAAYQVNAKLMSHTQKGALFLHCLPARRGEEVTDEVIDGPQSVVVQQAANRMHVQKGILTWLLGSHG